MSGRRAAEDAVLVARCRQDREALHASFRGLYDRHARAIYGSLCPLLNPEQAQDCLQETFLCVYLRLDRYDPASSFRAWAAGIARNLALEYRRRSASHRDAPLPEAAPSTESAEEKATQREEAALLWQAVGQLPDSDRELLLLRQVEGLPFDQIAAAAGCSLRTAKYRMRAAVDRLGVELRLRGLVGGTQ